MTQKSLFIVIEGLDGSGKTSVSRHLTNILEAGNHGRIKLTFEPHDPSCGGLFIRQVLMKKNRNFSLNTLMLAFATNRLDHCDREIIPWLNKGGIVICDRYYLSSLVYQSGGHNSFKSVFELNKYARKPDLIFFLNVSNKVCYERMKIRNEAKELFETNLSKTRNKFGQAIEFLRNHNSDTIVEIDASGKIEEVANQILERIYELRPELASHQPPLSRNLLPNLRITSLSKANLYTLEIAANELDLIDSEILKDKPEGVEWIESKIDLFDLNKLGGLFLDYIKCQGIEISDKLPWTEVDAYGLSYTMPGNIQLRGIALIIQEKQRYDVIMKKAPEIPEMSDFMYVFSPGPSELVTSYYERGIIPYDTENKQTGLFPATQLITQKDLAYEILNVAKKLSDTIRI